MIQFASSFEVCAGHLVGKLLDLHALLLRRLGSREFPQHPFPQALGYAALTLAPVLAQGCLPRAGGRVRT